MGYFNSTGQWVPGTDAILDTHTARGAGTRNGTGIEVGAAHTATVTVATTAVGGSPTLNAKLQTSEDNSTWRDIANGSFTEQTGVTSQTLTVSGLSTYLRAVSVIAGTGTPTITGTITAVMR